LEWSRDGAGAVLGELPNSFIERQLGVAVAVHAVVNVVGYAIGARESAL
jgi:hypothetical protein